MKNILVTGGCGYIGTTLVPKLVKKGFNVTVLDNFTFNQQVFAELYKFKNFEIIKGDVREQNLIRKLLIKNDIIIPLAALVGAPMCELDPFGTKTINEDSINFLAKETSADQMIIMPVSNSGYGIGKKNKHCDETSDLKPVSIYAKSKVEAEKIIMQRKNSISLRLATVFGMSERMRVDLLVNNFVYKAIHERSILIFEGHFKRNFIHIQDVTDAMIFCFENFEIMKNNIFNVGLDSANISKLELANLIQKFLPNFSIVQSEIGKDPDKRDYIVSNKKIMDKGFIPKYDLEFGIRELIKGLKFLSKSFSSNV
jgi:nucleoside-diphosphate-sugar epimerase